MGNKHVQQLLSSALLNLDEEQAADAIDSEDPDYQDDAPIKYRSIFISDIHVGTRHSQVNALLDFLKNNGSQYLYIVGDFIDGWELKRKWYWVDEYNTLLQKLLRKSRKGTKISVITGNHDEFLEDFVDIQFGRLKLMKETIHTTADRKRFLVIHGHQFDGIVHCNVWLEKLGSALYQWVLDLNLLFNRLRHRMGFGYWSFAAYLKMKAKSAVKYVADYENAMTSMARKRNVKGIICGHIHRAETKTLGDLFYFNTGDWVESCTALVEEMDGTFKLLKFHDADHDPEVLETVVTQTEFKELTAQ